MKHRSKLSKVNDSSAPRNEGDDAASKKAKRDGNCGLLDAKSVFLVCLVFRIINALLLRTYFNPDEHWQSLEVAHRTVFGYGHLTWEWKRGIRSYLHPLIFAFMYKFFETFGLDTPWFMARGPRLFQASFSAIGDLYLFKLALVLFNYNVAKWALFSQLANWFMFYCMNRTLSNSLETVLTLVSLYYWPCMRRSLVNEKSVSRKRALAIAALSCAIRPTSAITWLFLGIVELFSTRNKFRFIFLEVIPIGSLVLGITCLLDRWMYGGWIMVPLNFFKFNFLSSGGDYYGTHKWHWYFSQGFVVMLFTFTPFSFVGILKSKHHKLSALVLWVLLFYSFLGHKEFRFVLPMLPITLIFSGYSLASLTRGSSSISNRKNAFKCFLTCSSKPALAVAFLLITNVPMAFYMSLVHQRGSEDVIMYLSKEARENRVNRVLFLMPCHATPYYSTLHSNIPMRFLDCTPSENMGTLDESDTFMMNPRRFVSNLTQSGSLTGHVVMFDSEERVLRDLLRDYSFTERKRFFHAHFKVDRELQNSVVVYASNS